MELGRGMAYGGGFDSIRITKGLNDMRIRNSDTDPDIAGASGHTSTKVTYLDQDAKSVPGRHNQDGKPRQGWRIWRGMADVDQDGTCS